MLALAVALGLGGLAGSCGPERGGVESSLMVSAHRQPWRFAGNLGEQIATRHYRIFTTTANRSVLAVLPGFLEGAYRRYLDLTGLKERTEPTDLMPVYLLGDRKQWSLLTEQLTGPLSSVYLAVENGGYCFSGTCVFWDLGHFATFSVAAHEGLHQFLHHRMRDGLPIWAEEGLATQMEGFDLSTSTVRFDPARNVLRQTDLRTAITSGRWLGVPALLRTSPGEQLKGPPLTAPQYYGQVWALIMFIRSDPTYRTGFQRMIADAEAGKLPGPPLPSHARFGRQFRQAVAEPAFLDYIDRDPAGFETKFRAYAGRLAGLK